MRRFLLAVATATTVTIGSACGDSTGLGNSPVGSYELISVNGQGLPYSDGFVTFYAGILELESNGSFYDLLQYREVGDPAITSDEQTGSWERDGDDVLLDYDGGGQIFAERRSNSRLVLSSGGYTFEYRRF